MSAGARHSTGVPRGASFFSFFDASFFCAPKAGGGGAATKDAAKIRATATSRCVVRGCPNLIAYLFSGETGLTLLLALPLALAPVLVLVPLLLLALALLLLSVLAG